MDTPTPYSASAPPTSLTIWLEQIADAVILTTTDWQICYWNAAAERLYGWQSNEVLGRQFSTVVCPRHRINGLYSNEPTHALAATGQWRGEVLHQHRNGKPRQVDMRIQVMHDPHDTTTWYLAINRDIGPQRDAHEQANALQIMQRYAERMQLLADIAQAFAAPGQTINATLDQIAERCAQALGDTCFVRLISADRQYVLPGVIFTADGTMQATLRDAFSSAPQPISEGIAGQVIRSGEPLILTQISREEARASLPRAIQNLPDAMLPHSLIALPLRDSAGTFGAILFSRNQTPEPFSAADVDFARDLASRAELAISRAQLYERLVHQTELFQLVLNHLGDGVSVVDTEARLLVLNPAAERMFGRGITATAPDEWPATYGLWLPDQVTPLPAERLPLVRSLQGEVIDEEELFVRHPDAPQGLWINVTSRPLIDAAGVMQGAIAVCHDRTAHRQAEAERQASEARLRLAVNHFPAPFAIYDAHCRYLFVNETGVRFSGRALHDILGQRDEDLFPPEHTARYLPHLHTAARTGTMTSTEVELTVRGNIYTFVVTYVPLKNQRDVIEQIIGITHDITAQKQASRELQRYLNRLRVLHQVGQGLLVAQSLEQVARAVINQLPELLPNTWVGVFRYDPVALQLQSIALQPPQRSHIPLPATLQIDLTDSNEASPFWITQPWYVADMHTVSNLDDLAVVFRPYGMRSLVVAPLYVNDQLVGVLGLTSPEVQAFGSAQMALVEEVANLLAIGWRTVSLFTELQEERQMLARRVDERTADLVAANAQLARAARLKDEFLATMSHELRTPLNNILGRVEMLQEFIHGTLNAKQIETLQSVEESGTHLLALINDVLDLAKIEADQLTLTVEPVFLEDVVLAAVRMVRESAVTKQIALHTALAAHVGVVMTDQRRVKQILVNLLANAIKFTPAGGEVWVELGGDPVQQMISLHVRDTGIGVPADAHEQIFAPFVQIDSALSRQYVGTGLGLALVKRLVGHLGGLIALQSEVGVGSQFSVYLPWLREDGATPDQADTHAAALPTEQIMTVQAPRQPVILLAEDNPANQEVICDYLHAMGYRVQLALNGVEAVALALEAQPDLILMDVQMPIMDGLTAMQQIRAAGLTTTPIIALTALAMIGDQERCLDAGATAYLSKPVKLRALLTLIQAHQPPL
jgi:PAS domain S-box-containing protein